MIDEKTGRFCLVCSFDRHAEWLDHARAVEGLPTLEALEGKPLTDLLCWFHAPHYAQMNTFLKIYDAAGNPEAYANGVPIEIRVGARQRPLHPLPQVYSRDEVLELLEGMRDRLYLLAAQLKRGYLPEDPCEQPTVSLGEVIEQTKLRRDIRNFLGHERDTIAPAPAFPFQIQYPDDDDRISGEE